jgi:hypothetical protein
MSEFIWLEENSNGGQFKYDLLANVIHEGKPESGTYRI